MTVKEVFNVSSSSFNRWMGLAAILSGQLALVLLNMLVVSSAIIGSPSFLSRQAPGVLLLSLLLGLLFSADSYGGVREPDRAVRGPRFLPFSAI